jgi:1,4-alpha-glucan branching enzyme
VVEKKESSKLATRRVPLVVRQNGADEVRVTGDFTDWDEEGIRLSPVGDGQWRTVLPLEPGQYQYRLIVDGAWRDHADAKERVANPFGSENCVLKVV